MIMVGKCLLSTDDILQKTTVAYLVNAIRNPKKEIEMRIRQLRGVYALNPSQYNIVKRQLPYFVCGTFNPPYRRKDNFVCTDIFILDMDKLQAKGLDIDTVRSVIQTDPRVLVCFKSPSEDGLKIMFRTSEPIYDHAQYTIFYKEFLRTFSFYHNLEQVADYATSDASRACFISIDPDIYYNPDATAIDTSQYIPDDFDNFLRLKSIQAQEEASLSSSEQQVSLPQDPPDDILAKIKEKLNPRIKVTQRDPFVPEILNEILDGLKNHICSFGITVDDISSIQYGKKLKCSIARKRGEINIFYGKRGFSFVKSPKTGTDDEFNGILCDIAQQYIATL